MQISELIYLCLLGIGVISLGMLLRRLTMSSISTIQKKIDEYNQLQRRVTFLETYYRDLEACPYLVDLINKKRAEEVKWGVTAFSSSQEEQCRRLVRKLYS